MNAVSIESSLIRKVDRRSDRCTKTEYREDGGGWFESQSAETAKSGTVTADQNRWSVLQFIGEEKEAGSLIST